MTAALRTIAADLITANGQTMTLTRRSAGAYNPATGASAITETTQTVRGVVLPLGRKQKAAENVPADTRQCLLAAVATNGSVLTAPKVDDFVTDAAGLKYAVTGIEPLSPAGTDIYYDLAVRAAV